MASEVAWAVGGRLFGPDVEVSGASIDSRTLAPGELFVPVVAERDGHDYIADALAAGAAAYLTAEAPRGASAVAVDDTAAALAELGHYARSAFDGPVVGITGSVGKTSVKDMAAAAIGADRPTHASPMSFNNELGVPLTLANRPEGAEAVVVGHLPGKGRLAGMLGALLVETPDGRRFRLGTGFSDEERREPPPLGATVTYRYFGKTRNGVPRFASFLRIRNEM